MDRGRSWFTLDRCSEAVPSRGGGEWGADGGVGTVQVTKLAHRGSWLRLRRAPKPSFYPEETLRNIFFFLKMTRISDF